MKAEEYFEDKKFRNKLKNRTEVLDKVKELLTLPELEYATMQQVADYYEVDRDTIKKLYQRSKDELKESGTISMKGKDVINDIYGDEFDVNSLNSNDSKDGTTCPVLKFKKVKGGIKVDDIKINYAYNVLFNRRSILLIGMLLRDSKVAKEVRNQLLNLTEGVSDEIKLKEINKEKELVSKITEAYLTHDSSKILCACAEYEKYLERHIAKLEETNEALTHSILEWKDRDKLNYAVRKLAYLTGTLYGQMYNELYNELKYKHHIDVKRRGKSPYIKNINEDEWDNVMTTFSAMCKSYGYEPSDIIHHADKIEEKVS